MIKEEKLVLGKINKSILFLIPLLLLLSCNKEIENIKELSEIKYTHTIIDNRIETALDILIEENNSLKDKDDNLIILYIKSKEKNQASISLAYSNFETFLKNKPKKIDPFQGLISYQDWNILIFGDFNDSYFRKENSSKLILKNMKSERVSIYEPTYLNFLLEGENIKMLENSY
ncbi:hypothetical protein [Kordia jejudonensis]|uniref:hypothetical protein n=1 Tax=Kordia jejudonensis TaxID=1348245 RepID=UPI0006295513|nr:hypothetical protein [Kordia jejudonensis]